MHRPSKLTETFARKTFFPFFVAKLKTKILRSSFSGADIRMKTSDLVPPV